VSPLDYRHVTEFKPVPAPSGGSKCRGRKPQGESALTGAERQARYRQRQADNRAAAPPHPPRSIRRPSRPQQWHAAVTTLVALQAAYAAWLDALPEALRDSATGAALQAIVDLDLDELASIEPPRGFGRD
jgi:ferric-dicitrate binding protein FerR (iron transport regulator)